PMGGGAAEDVDPNNFMKINPTYRIHSGGLLVPGKAKPASRGRRSPARRSLSGLPPLLPPGRQGALGAVFLFAPPFWSRIGIAGLLPPGSAGPGGPAASPRRPSTTGPARRTSSTGSAAWPGATASARGRVTGLRRWRVTRRRVGRRVLPRVLRVPV